MFKVKITRREWDHYKRQFVNHSENDLPTLPGGSYIEQTARNPSWALGLPHTLYIPDGRFLDGSKKMKEIWMEASEVQVIDPTTYKVTGFVVDYIDALDDFGVMTRRDIFTKEEWTVAIVDEPTVLEKGSSPARSE